MTETEIRAYLIEAYTRAVLRARAEYRAHPFSNHHPACPCRRVKHAEAAKRSRDRKDPK